MGIIYKATCRKNGKAYIGQTIRTLKERIYEHLKEARNNSKQYSLFHKAIRKYGKNNFDWIILCTCEDKYLNQKEIFYIEQENTYTENGGYNLTKGGDNNFGTKGEYHWLNRKEDKDKWIEENRVGENNPNFGHGEAIRGDKHFLNKMSQEEKEKWLDEHLRGDNNYQKKLSLQERKDRHWIHNKSGEEIKNFKKKLSGKNNGFARKMKNDPEFRKKYLENKSKPPRQTKIWKITSPDGIVEIIDDLSKYIKEKQPTWNRSGIGTAVFYKRPYKGHLIEEVINED